MILLTLAMAVEPTPTDAPPQPEGDVLILGTLGGVTADDVMTGELGALIGVALGGESHDTAKVDVDYDPKKRVVDVTNNKAYPITFTVDLSVSRNARVVPPAPNAVVIPPGGRTRFRIVARKPGDFDSSYTWAWTTGDRRKTHDVDHLYSFPWPEGMDFECRQNSNGKSSHRGDHAVDFKMPVGTPIHAARAGTVISITDGWGPGADDTSYYHKANSVRILHEDGTLADYVHLKAGGMKVAMGDRVEQGQRIATSGNSGFTRGPHLHFAVKSAQDGWIYRTWRTAFDVGGEPVWPTKGTLYPSMVDVD